MLYCLVPFYHLNETIQNFQNSAIYKNIIAVLILSILLRTASIALLTLIKNFVQPSSPKTLSIFEQQLYQSKIR